MWPKRVKKLTLEEVVETFEYLDDWEDRYKYLIDLGRHLDGFPEADKTEDNRVQGCTSRVWLTNRLEGGKIIFQGESDAHIVRGLVCLMLLIFSGKTPADIIKTDEKSVLGQLGLEKHLSPMRTNGLFAMVERIKQTAHLYI